MGLVLSLLVRPNLLGRREDYHKAIRLTSIFFDNQCAQEPDKFRLSCVWAFVARNISHPTTLTTYKSAMSLMHKCLYFAPSISIQHGHFVAMGRNCKTTPLDYAPFQVDSGRFEEVLMTLEQGQALLWSEMRGLRPPMYKSVKKVLPLMKRITELGQGLGALVIYATPSGRPGIEDGVAQGSNWTDPCGLPVAKQRDVVDERDTPISQVQGRPGLQGFLMTPLSTLRSTASHDPVIIINHCKWRSDILITFDKILLAPFLPQLISTIARTDYGISYSRRGSMASIPGNSRTLYLLS